jgi:hypothetical protein
MRLGEPLPHLWFCPGGQDFEMWEQFPQNSLYSLLA